MWYLLGVILWAILAFWPAIIARRKGYSFLLFLLLSIPFFVVTLIVVYMLKDKTQTAADRAADRAAEKALDREEDQA
jgi:hypothetical protein